MGVLLREYENMTIEQLEQVVAALEMAVKPGTSNKSPNRPRLDAARRELRRKRYLRVKSMLKVNNN